MNPIISQQQEHFSNFCFDSVHLNNLATQHARKYAQAQPFPHIVIDNFLPENVLIEILKEFPKPEWRDWKNFNRETEKKLESRTELYLGEATRLLLYQFNSSVFISFLEKLTGIEGLIPDPHFEGGGLHQIAKGGFLKIHADFNRHRKLQLDRRLNLLLYLNQNWQEEYGGHLELWDSKMVQCERKILPIFNRCVIFSTTDFSFHGHPEPLTCPKGWTRKSIALYYYSNGRPPEEVSESHSTLFQARPGESFSQKEPKSVSLQLKETMKKFVPPILFDLGKALNKNS